MTAKQAVHAYIVTTVGASTSADSAASDLASVISAVAQQTRRPDHVTLVGVGEVPSNAAATLREQFGSHASIVHVPTAKNFGDALRQAMTAPPGRISAGWYWLLHDDSKPQPEALAQLLNSTAQGANIGVVGPKQVSWDNPGELLELGIEATRTGRRVPLGVSREIDQGQYDGRVDVLAVGTAGMLVRSDTWTELRGLDPQLGPFGDGLEFGRRARRAGYRVVVAPKAVIAHRQVSADPPEASFGKRRAAQMYNWLVAAPPGLPLLIFPFLLLWVPLRALGRLLTRRPSYMGGELAALVALVGALPGVRRARRRDSATAVLSRRQLTQLEATPLDLEARRRHARRVARTRQKPADLVDAATRRVLASNRRNSRNTFSGILLLTTALSLYFWYPLLQGMRGGNWGQFPLTQAQLWQQAWSDWVYAGVGAPGPVNSLLPLFSLISAPFAPVGISANTVATTALVLAMPLSAATAWLLSGTFTRSPQWRAVGALLWAFQPGLMLSLGIADLSSALMWVLLPLLLTGLWRGLRGSRPLHVESVTDTVLQTRSDTAAWVAVAAVAGAGAASGAPIVAVLLLFVGLLLATVPAQELLPPTARTLIGSAEAGATTTVVGTPRHTRVLLALLVWMPAALITAPTIGWGLTHLDSAAGWKALLVPNGDPTWTAVPHWLWAPAFLLAALAAGSLIRCALRGREPVINLMALVAVVTLWAAAANPSAASTLVPVAMLFLLVTAQLGLSPSTLRADRTERKNFAAPLAVTFVFAVGVAGYIGTLILGPLAHGQPEALEETRGHTAPLVSQQAALSDTEGRTLVLTSVEGEPTYARLWRQGARSQTDLSLGLQVSELPSRFVAEETLATAIGQITARTAPEAPTIFAEHGIELILLTPGSASGTGSLEANLDSTDGLERIGTTDLGSMWRVRAGKGLTGRIYATSQPLPIFLAEPAAPAWRATAGGLHLEPLQDVAAETEAENEAEWRQAFVAPVDTAAVRFSYAPGWVPWWMWGTLTVLAVTLIQAVPWRRKSTAWFTVSDAVAPSTVSGESEASLESEVEFAVGSGSDGGVPIVEQVDTGLKGASSDDAEG